MPDLARLSAIAVVTGVAAGQTFVDEGEPATCFFMSAPAPPSCDLFGAQRDHGIAPPEADIRIRLGEFTGVAHESESIAKSPEPVGAFDPCRLVPKHHSGACTRYASALSPTVSDDERAECDVTVAEDGFYQPF